jgi:hypothetical protein
VFDIVNGIGAEPSVEVGPVGAHSADIPRRLIRRQIPSTLADIHAFARSIWLACPVAVPSACLLYMKRLKLAALSE